MKELLAFFDVHWFLAFIALISVTQLLSWPFQLVNRFFRHLNIRNAGWPPNHVDADGDAVKPEEDE